MIFSGTLDASPASSVPLMNLFDYHITYCSGHGHTLDSELFGTIICMYTYF